MSDPLAGRGPGTATVVALCPIERVCQDIEPIATIYRNLSHASAEQVVARALTELAITMAGLAAHVRAQEPGEMARQLRRLQRMSANMGMVSLGLVAADVRSCLDHGDATAFSAVWARLLRVAERSLATDRDVAGQTQV